MLPVSFHGLLDDLWMFSLLCERLTLFRILWDPQKKSFVAALIQIILFRVSCGTLPEAVTGFVQDPWQNFSRTLFLPTAWAAENSKRIFFSKISGGHKVYFLCQCKYDMVVIKPLLY